MYTEARNSEGSGREKCKQDSINMINMINKTVY